MIKRVQKNPSETENRYSLERKSDNTITIKVVVPHKDVEAIREKVVGELIKQIELPGFRKGEVPRKLAEAKLNKETIREELLKKILTSEYISAVKSFDIKPIVNPKVHIEQFAEGTDIEFEAETCEEPEIKLGTYREEIQKVTAKGKIVVPHSASSGQAGKEPEKVGIDEILNAVLNIAEISIPKILIEQETNRLLSQLLDEIKRLGVSLDQYLASRGKNEEELRGEYQVRAEKDLKLEFLLRKIADEEKITVEQKEIDAALASIKDEKQKQEVAQNPYLVAAIIRQQKTLDWLSKL